MAQLHIAAQFSDFAHRILHQLDKAARSFQGFDVQRHLVVGHFAGDDQARALDLREALDHLGHLTRVHKHATHLGGLVGAAQPALDAHVGAACGAAARQDGR